MEWDGTPYHSLNWEIRKQFGKKLYKISLDGGMTCPNRDGTVGYGGCIFCSEGGVPVISRPTGAVCEGAAEDCQGKDQRQAAQGKARRIYRLFSGIYEHIRSSRKAGDSFYGGDGG